MIFWPSLVVACFPESFKDLLLLSPQRGLGANFFRDCVCPRSERKSEKLQPVSATCSRTPTPHHWEYLFTVCGHFCLSKKKKNWEAWHTLRREWSFCFKWSRVGGLPGQLSLLPEEAPRVSCLQMPPAVSFQAKLLMFHVSSPKGM